MIVLHLDRPMVPWSCLFAAVVEGIHQYPGLIAHQDVLRDLIKYLSATFFIASLVPAIPTHPN